MGLGKSMCSVRAYDGREITAEDKAKLCRFMMGKSIKADYGLLTVNLSYKNIMEFGWILDWTGEVVTGQ